MNSVQRYLSLSAAALLSFATAALAEPPENSAASGGREGETSSFLCHAALCETNQDCAAACSTAQTATCVANECHYTYPGGGGGGGGPICAEMLCMSDAECVCGWKQGYCSTNQVCVF